MLTGAGMVLKVMMWPWPWLPIGSTKGKEEVMGVLACLVMAWEVPRERNHLPRPAQGNERVGDHRTIHPSSLAIYPRGLEMTE